MRSVSSDPVSQSYALWRQALAGDTEGALWAIERMESAGMPILTADLLARLYVRKGRFGEAKTIWQRILQADPGYLPAVRALARMNSPWVLTRGLRRFASMLGIVMLVILALYGVGMLIFGFSNPAYAVIGAGVILSVLAVFLFGLATWAYLAVTCAPSSPQNSTGPFPRDYPVECRSP